MDITLSPDHCAIEENAERSGGAPEAIAIPVEVEGTDNGYLHWNLAASSLATIAEFSRGVRAIVG